MGWGLINMEEAVAGTWRVAMGGRPGGKKAGPSAAEKEAKTAKGSVSVGRRKLSEQG